MNKTINFKIIAETAFSHEGDIGYLYKQIDEAKKGQVDFIKFQVLVDPQESYVNIQEIDKIREWIFDKSDWVKIFKYANDINLQIIALPINQSSAKFCIQYERLIDAYEIHSVCFHDIYTIDELVKTKKDVILGIGGRLPQEIDAVIKQFKCNKIILMTGFQSFPTDYNYIGLKKIRSLKELFNCEIGYADHTKFDDVFFHNLNDYAFINGANYFEKHIVLEKGRKRIDFESGIKADDFMKLRESLNRITQILGDGNIFNLNDKELIYRKREKQIVYAKDLYKEHIIKKEDLFFKISNDKSDFEQVDIKSVIGRKILKDVRANEVVRYAHLGERINETY